MTVRKVCFCVAIVSLLVSVPALAQSANKPSTFDKVIQSVQNLVGVIRTKMNAKMTNKTAGTIASAKRSVASSDLTTSSVLNSSWVSINTANVGLPRPMQQPVLLNSNLASISASNVGLPRPMQQPIRPMH
jgi:hypothetical protein